jgi:4-alpha-glucanotransferase
MIQELARIIGVENAYIDFYGNVHTLSREALSSLLQAMGYEVASDADARRCVERLRAQAEPLDSVYVLRAGEPAAIPCRFGRPCAWNLESESGSTRRGDGSADRIALEPLEPGYYRLLAGDHRSTLICVPPVAFTPQEIETRKLWGISAQLYSLRSDGNWGIGDFSDLATLLRIARNAGAAAVAVNPLHELSLTNPTSASPYGPTSRLFLNVLYLDVPAAAKRVGLRDGVERSVDPEILAALRDATLVDYAGVARAKLSALRALHAAFRKTHNAEPCAAFSGFVKGGGEMLESVARYEALMETFKRNGPHTYGWRQWPSEYHDPRSAAVEKFAREHAQDVEFHQFLQWLADEQLAAAAASASGMPIGLYRDLAVGVDANGADVWADRDAYSLNVCVGAPPDPLNPIGQNWSLPPLDPLMLRARAYAPYISLLRANMRHAGALRIDHVMGVMRLFCIPAGAQASRGTYLSYRFDEMLGILALESHRNGCMIVGEDLGTVPAGFRERLSAAGVFGYRLLYFEREPDGRFRPPERYDSRVVASTGTHDVAPLAGFWSGTDLRQRSTLGFFPDEAAAARAVEERATARKFLLEILVERGFVGINEAKDLENRQESAADNLLFSLVVAAYRLLGRSAARLLLIQLEDALLQRDQVNTPGTFDEVPNWRRRLALSLDALENDTRFRILTRAVTEARRE